MPLLSIANSDQVFDAVERIALHRGNAQQELLETCLKQSFFLDICKAANDPFVTYGVKQVPKRSPHATGTKTLEQCHFDLLKLLANRELTGNAAKHAIQTALDELSPKSAELFTRIIKKDLRANFSAKAINKAVPNAIYTFECMLAHKFDEARIQYPVAIEPKYDGVRVLAIVKEGTAKTFSRTGKEFLNYGPICNKLVQIAKAYNKLTGKSCAWLFDGEVIDGSFNNTVGSAHRKGEEATDAVFMVFEAMPLYEFMCGSTVKHLARRLRMNDVFAAAMTEGVKLDNVQRVKSLVARNLDDIMNLYSRVRESGGEGVIVKSLSGLYERKRSHAWLKIKAEETVDLVVKDVFEGEGKYEGLIGGLIVNFNGVEVRVGSGLSDDDRQKDPKFWVGKLIEIHYHEVTPDGSLRHPRFVRIRDDKPVSDGAGV